MKIKNKYKIILTILTLCVFFSFLKTNTMVKAEDIQMLVMEGFSKIEIVADSCTLNFNIKLNEQEFESGQNSINDVIKNATNTIQKINANNTLIVTYTSCHPTYKDSLVVYNCSCSFSVKTNQLESVNDIIGEIGKLGQISYYGADYQVENTQEKYMEALNLAKADAVEKAKSLNQNAELKAIIGTNVYNYCNGESGKIIIEANVKGVFVNSALSQKETTPEQKIQQQKISQKNFC